VPSGIALTRAASYRAAMTNRATSRLFRRLGLTAPLSRRAPRSRPRPGEALLAALESPRRVWLFGPELRPKTVPLKRLR